MRRPARLAHLEDRTRGRVRAWLASLSDEDLNAAAVRWAGMAQGDVEAMRARIEALSDDELLALAALDEGAP